MKIEFYILAAPTRQEALRWVCQLTEKSYHNQESIFIHTENNQDAAYLDQLLWTYRDDGFIPHHLHHPEPIQDCRAPIHIGETSPNEAFQGVLFNLNSRFTLSHLSYSRVVEIVFPDPNVQQLARERYRQYQQTGHELLTYKIQANDL
jgi:DNA polymerase-3 subunit chi